MPRQLAEISTPVPVIAIADDDAMFRESVAGNLADYGYEVREFPDGAALLEGFDADDIPDLILLDWKMPRVNGIEALRRMREAGIEVPVIFLTVLNDQFYEEAALHGGAMDFVEKSRSFSILHKRIELILNGPKLQRESEAPGDNLDMPDDIVVGPLRLIAQNSRAHWHDLEVPLTFTEFRIVHMLASRPGSDVSYRDLYDVVHGEGFYAGIGDDGYRANVRTFIKRIRKKFREIDGSFEAIENYPGYGYRWRA